MTSQPRRFAPRSAALLAFIGLVFLAAGVATWFYPPPPEFTARMKLHVARTPPRILFQHKESEEIDSNAFIRGQADLIRDRFTILRALGDTRDPEFTIANLSMIQEQNDPAQWLEERIAVDFPSPEYMNITLSGDRGEELKKIVAAVTKAYLENYVNKERIARDNRRKGIEDSRTKFEKKMENLKRQLHERQRTQEATDLSQLQDEIDAVRKVLAKATEQINTMEVEQEAPPRITPVYDKPVLEKPNETKRKTRMAVAAALVGVGMLLLIVAVFQFRADQRHDIVEHPPSPSPPK